MKVEIIKTKKGTYKIISDSNHKHPALEHIAGLLKETNKHSEIKIGVFNVPSTKFTTFQKVFSYITGRTESLNRKNFYQWRNGSRQLKQKKPWAKNLTEVEVNETTEEQWDKFGEALVGKDGRET